MSGKVTSNDTSWNIMPSNDDKGIPIDRVIQAGEGLSRGQKLYPVTRGAHAVMILNRDLDILSIAEDVGRHNAIDKAIGKVLVSGKLSGAFMGVLSSRVSMEMLQKANRANIPFLLSGSRPTSLAVDMGKSLNMTLACLTSDSELIIFAGEERILR